jgi:hypothetical protein
MEQLRLIAQPYILAEGLIMAATLSSRSLCLDALHGERRVRILFWKSLPVSDFTTVFSKMSIPRGYASAHLHHHRCAGGQLALSSAVLLKVALLRCGHLSLFRCG